ncbi:MAG: hypothetical protein ACREUX_03520 [Burkholderiales bacterium]
MTTTKVKAPFDAANLARHLGLPLPAVPGEPLLDVAWADGTMRHHAA